MKNWPMVLMFIAGAATGCYVGICIGYVVGRWDTKFRQWCRALEERLKTGESR